MQEHLCLLAALLFLAIFCTLIVICAVMLASIKEEAQARFKIRAYKLEPKDPDEYDLVPKENGRD